jgi:predicted PhzF superfamily epimerase YddE/YHI9
MRARVQQVVTFAATPFAGNPAIVVSIAEPVADGRLAQVCEELQADLIAVLFEPASAGQVDLAFFTPSGSHPGAGHAAHAAAHVSLRTRSSVDFRLPNGGTLAARTVDGRVGVTWPAMAYAEVSLGARLGPMLGREPRATLDAAFGHVALFDSASELAAIKPDLKAIESLERGALIVTAPAERADFALRVFAPKLGLPEDPVCGTAHRIIAPYWGRILGRSHLRSRQMSPRGGDLWCDVGSGRVTISGDSVTFLDGSIEFPSAEQTVRQRVKP